MKEPRYIKSNLKSKRIVFEEEHPIRWSFMKVLREYSTLKQEFAINPYVEVYKFRDNLYCLYSESLDGAGDPWMYVIEGPKKAMLIDTGFGVGDLKGLIKELIPDKELIVVNTHAHFDHAYGNAQFERCYCHEAEVERMKKTNNDKIWDYLFDENEKPIYTEFDRNDLIEYHEYEIVGVKDGHIFDLGDGYEVEAVHLPGHTPGQCGFYDLHNKTMFIGDTTGIGRIFEGEPFTEFCTVSALRDALVKLKPRFDEMSGVFPGHGMLDQTPSVLQYLLDTCNQIIENPLNFDKEIVMERHGTVQKMYKKNIHQGTALRYKLENVK